MLLLVIVCYVYGWGMSEEMIVDAGCTAAFGDGYEGSKYFIVDELYSCYERDTTMYPKYEYCCREDFDTIEEKEEYDYAVELCGDLIPTEDWRDCAEGCFDILDYGLPYYFCCPEESLDTFCLSPTKIPESTATQECMNEFGDDYFAKNSDYLYICEDYVQGVFKTWNFCCKSPSLCVTGQDYEDGYLACNSIKNDAKNSKVLAYYGYNYEGELFPNFDLCPGYKPTEPMLSKINCALKTMDYCCTDYDFSNTEFLETSKQECMDVFGEEYTRTSIEYLGGGYEEESDDDEKKGIYTFICEEHVNDELNYCCRPIFTFEGHPISSELIDEDDYQETCEDFFGLDFFAIGTGSEEDDNEDYECYCYNHPGMSEEFVLDENNCEKKYVARSGVKCCREKYQNEKVACSNDDEEANSIVIKTYTGTYKYDDTKDKAYACWDSEILGTGCKGLQKSKCTERREGKIDYWKLMTVDEDDKDLMKPNHFASDFIDELYVCTCGSDMWYGGVDELIFYDVVGQNIGKKKKDRKRRRRRRKKKRGGNKNKRWDMDFDFDFSDGLLNGVVVERKTLFVGDMMYLSKDKSEGTECVLFVKDENGNFLENAIPSSKPSYNSYTYC